jgi:hypothetical protein
MLPLYKAANTVVLVGRWNYPRGTRQGWGRCRIPVRYPKGGPNNPHDFDAVDEACAYIIERAA